MGGKQRDVYQLSQTQDFIEDPPDKTDDSNQKFSFQAPGSNLAEKEEEEH